MIHALPLFAALLGAAPPPPAPFTPPAADDAPAADAASEGYTPPEEDSPLTLTGYVDVGFARAAGNGSSFHPDDTRIPADYGADAFATAVNSRGEVASIDAGGRYVNGFLPRSVGIGSHASFLVNTASADMRYAPAGLPFFVFARAQLLPRFGSDGAKTELVLQQAFGRISPIPGHELSLSLGKFDPVFGIEYLENEANIRTNVTPSLIARYTTGQVLGAKAFYRLQLPALWSALSLNASVTNGSTKVDSLQVADVSLTGGLFGAARLGYELQLHRLQVKLGASGEVGPRNDQSDARSLQRALGFDARLVAGWVSLAGEYFRGVDDPGRSEGKLTGTGRYALASGFHVEGYYSTLAVGVPLGGAALERLTLYGRYGRRRGGFTGYGDLLTSRVTAGARLDAWGALALKAEYLFNHEHAGAPRVPNDVFTASAVYTW